MIDHRTVQHFLQANGWYKKNLDGLWGGESRIAVDRCLKAKTIKTAGWTEARKRIAVEQLMFIGVKINPGKEIVVDGVSGPVYQYALELWQNHLRDIQTPPALVAHQPTVWPRQKDIESFYGARGKRQKKLVSPYPLYLDWDLSGMTKGFSIHELCHDSALRVMTRVFDHYGAVRIHEMGLDQFGGCFNVRKMRGGSAWSMHSWGIAIDWDADRNPLRAGRDTALFAQPAYARFLDLWEEEGWISLGRERNMDYMHVQAARL